MNRRGFLGGFTLGVAGLYVPKKTYFFLGGGDVPMMRFYNPFTIPECYGKIVVPNPMKITAPHWPKPFIAAMEREVAGQWRALRTLHGPVEEMTDLHTIPWNDATGR